MRIRIYGHKPLIRIVWAQPGRKPYPACKLHSLYTPVSMIRKLIDSSSLANCESYNLIYETTISLLTINAIFRFRRWLWTWSIIKRNSISLLLVNAREHPKILSGDKRFTRKLYLSANWLISTCRWRRIKIQFHFVLEIILKVQVSSAKTPKICVGEEAGGGTTGFIHAISCFLFLWHTLLLPGFSTRCVSCEISDDSMFCKAFL